MTISTKQKCLDRQKMSMNYMKNCMCNYFIILLLTFFCWRWSAYLKVSLKSVALDGGWHLINALPDCIFFKENIDV